MIAAVHLLRYGDGEEVGERFRGAGEIGWLLSLPERPTAAAEVLSAAREVLDSWDVRREEVCSGGLPVPAFGGVPDCWPHVAEALKEAGYEAGTEHREALYGGILAQVPKPPASSPGLKVVRIVGKFGICFSAVRAGNEGSGGADEVGHLDCAADLTQGGALPALRGWAELAELWVGEQYRGRGIGTQLVGHAADWLHQAG